MFRRVLFHSPGEARLAADVAGTAELRSFRGQGWALAPDEVGVLLAESSLAPALAEPPPPNVGQAADRIGLLLLTSSERLPAVDAFWSARVSFALPGASPQAHVRRAVDTLHRLLEDRARGAADRRALLDRQGEIHALVDVGIALSAETDLERLLETILTRARTLTSADAGSLYLVETGERGGGERGTSSDALRFVRAQNDSVRFEFQSAILPIEPSSIAGFVAGSSETVVLPDVRQLPPGVPYRFDPAFDERYRYRTRSILAVPMKTPDGRTIGVLQLLNRKRRVIPDGGVTAFILSEVVPFDPGDVEIARALAAQAAVAVENRRLTESIRTLLEGFVEASVTAIEQRDPATSGHSHRVARLTCALAEAADRTQTGPFASWRAAPEEMRELRYAAVLHDFGKVGVREDVLIKAQKLSPAAFAVLRSRFAEAALAAAAEVWEAAARGHLPASEAPAAIAERRRVLARAWQAVERVNSPTVLSRDVGEELEHLRGLTYRRDGAAAPLLGPGELDCLAIPRGSLTPAERAEIESHVAQTFRFLSKIPWTRDLARVPDWAHAHHEKLDGSGYPRGLRAEAIPPPVRMLTICDIYDALAARDRPYKPAVEKRRAIDILAAEASRGAIDGELLRLFVEAGVYRLIEEPGARDAR
jgi:HD-GYP domain-containing protein (c-di-GMP phosphodiesterase class II)